MHYELKKRGCYEVRPKGGLLSRSDKKIKGETKMSTTRKKHLDYFPLDVHLNEKFELLEAEYGLKGFGVIIKLYQRIYGSEGYYCKWNEEVALLFSKQINEGCSVVSEIVKTAVKRGLFNERLFKQYGILTSEGIQKRYINVVKSLKRSQIELEKPFRLVSPTEKCEPCGESSKNYGENQKSSGKNALKEKKGKEIKENKIKENESKGNKRASYGKYSHVTLTPKEYDLLIDEYKDDTDGIINFLDEKIEANGYHYSNCFFKIKQWAATAYLTEVKPKLLKKACGKLLEDVRAEIEAKEKNVL